MDVRLPRRLAGILYADVVGYSRLMGSDEIQLIVPCVVILTSLPKASTVTTVR